MLTKSWFSTRSALAIVLVVVAATVASCAKHEETTTSDNTTTPPPDTSMGMTAAPLTDANIAAIVVAANTADIKNGELAKSKSKNAEVTAFANQMVTDHTAVNKQATDLVTKLNVTPEPNDTSRQLESGAEATRGGLQGMDGAAFDKAYIDNEVAYHQQVLDALDQTLIPNAQNAELKALLESSRPAFAAHLDHAKKVQADLAK